MTDLDELERAIAVTGDQTPTRQRLFLAWSALPSLLRELRALRRVAEAARLVLRPQGYRREDVLALRAALEALDARAVEPGQK